MVKLAKPSPRIEDGIIKWYAWDTFDLNFEFIFTDEDWNKIPEEETDCLEFTIYNQYYDVLYSTEVHQSHEVPVSIDEEMTQKFTRGNYYYIIRRIAGYITTIIQENEIIVE